MSSNEHQGKVTVWSVLIDDNSFDVTIKDRETGAHFTITGNKSLQDAKDKVGNFIGKKIKPAFGKFHNLKGKA